jgi:hypothetical protein
MPLNYLRWHDVHTMFHEDRHRRSNVVRRKVHMQTHAAWWSHEPMSVVLKIR